MIDESEFLKSLEAARERLENPEPAAKTVQEQPKEEKKAAAPKRAPQPETVKVEEAAQQEVPVKAEELVINEPVETAVSEEKSKVNVKAVSMILGGCAIVISVVFSLIKVFFVSSDYLQIASFLISIAAIITGALMMKKTGKGGLCLVFGIIALVVTLLMAPLITALMFGIA